MLKHLFLWAMIKILIMTYDNVTDCFSAIEMYKHKSLASLFKLSNIIFDSKRSREIDSNRRYTGAANTAC